MALTSPSIRVLLIEDSPLDARLIEAMVAEAGGDAIELERAERLDAGLARLAVSRSSKRAHLSHLTAGTPSAELTCWRRRSLFIGFPSKASQPLDNARSASGPS